MRIIRLRKPSLIPILMLAAASLRAPAARARVCEPVMSADGADAGPDLVPAPLTLAVPGAAGGPGEVIQQPAGAPAGAGQGAEKKQDSDADVKTPNLRVNPVTGLVTTTGAAYQPLTGKERWRLYWKMNFLSVGAYFGPFVNALLLDQATGSPAAWGGGFKGYDRRVASRIGSAILQGTFQAPVAAVLHEDVRYIASTQSGFKRRAWHAVKYSILTYNDSGRPTLNIANLSAYYAATAVSTAWLPGRYNVASYALSNSSAQVALTVPVNLLQEFWPEVQHVLHRH